MNLTELLIYWILQPWFSFVILGFGVALIGGGLVFKMKMAREADALYPSQKTSAPEKKSSKAKEKAHREKKPSAVKHISEDTYAPPQDMIIIPKNESTPLLSKDRESVLTEQARQRMMEMMVQVKSLHTLEEAPNETENEEAKRQQVEALSDSGVIDAMLQDWVSTPITEETEMGRFSKMSIQGVLLFDGEELEKKS